VARADREENDNTILRKVQEELGKNSNEINKERSAREASEQAIDELLKDVVSRVKVFFFFMYSEKLKIGGN
jgi:hypothetical protein